MKVENVREVKARLNRLIKDLPRSGSILITRNGKACAALLPITEDTDLEALVLSGSKRFWQIIDSAYRRADKEGWTDFDELE